MTKTIQAFRRPARNRAGLFSPLTAAWIALAPAFPASPAMGQALEPDSLLAHVRYLAADELRGREPGQPGADSAAAYIARHLREYGLEPLGSDGYRQPFGVTLTARILPESRLLLRSPNGERELKLGEEWLPFLFSDSGRVAGKVARPGYGLSDEDYAGLAAGPGGSLVVVLRGGTPAGFDPHGAGGDATPRFKATLARRHGADAVLITVPRLEAPRPGDPPHSIGIPAAQLLERPDVLGWLDEEGVEVTLDARVEPVEATAYNLIGRLPGRDPRLAEEIVVIGAHYDHIGMGGPGSLAPDVEAIHNGADDNASGTALLLGLARYFAQNPERRPARSLVFVAFSAEEMGLLGSEYVVSHPPFPLERVTAMINFDMVGRLGDEDLQVFGTESAEEFTALIDSLDAAAAGVEVTNIGDGYGPSDQTSFYARGIPVLHFFTGTHSQYHRPEDDWELIDAAGMATVGELAIGVIDALGSRTTRLTLVEQERPGGGGGRGYGPYLGTIPDFGEVEGGGLRLSGVRAGSPAEEAGLRAGDVVIEFSGREITNIYDYTYALRDHSPGDTVEITVRREDGTATLKAVLKRRR